MKRKYLKLKSTKVVLLSTLLLSSLIITPLIVVSCSSTNNSTSSAPNVPTPPSQPETPTPPPTPDVPNPNPPSEPETPTPPPTPDVPNPNPPSEPETPTPPPTPDVPNPNPPSEPETPTPPSTPDVPSPTPPSEPETPTPPVHQIIDLNKEFGIDKNLPIGIFSITNVTSYKNVNKTKAVWTISYLENNIIKFKSGEFQLPNYDAQFTLVFNNYQNDFLNYSNSEMSGLNIAFDSQYKYKFDIEIQNSDIVKYDINNIDKIYIKDTSLTLRPYEDIATSNTTTIINGIDMSNTFTLKVGSEDSETELSLIKNENPYIELRDKKNPNLTPRKCFINTDILIVDSDSAYAKFILSSNLYGLRMYAQNSTYVEINAKANQYQMILNEELPTSKLVSTYKPSDELKKVFSEQEFNKMLELFQTYDGNNSLTFPYGGATNQKNYKTNYFKAIGNKIVFDVSVDIDWGASGGWRKSTDKYVWKLNTDPTIDSPFLLCNIHIINDNNLGQAPNYTLSSDTEFKEKINFYTLENFHKFISDYKGIWNDNNFIVK